MSRLLIAYDLRKPNYDEKDYANLYAELERLKAKQVQELVWAVRTDLTSNTIFTRLIRHMHRLDRLLVARINGYRSRNALHLLRLI